MRSKIKDSRMLRQLAHRVLKGKSRILSISIPIYKKQNIVRIDLIWSK